MDNRTRALMMGAAGAGGAAEKTYVEDVFSTWLYTGSNSNQTIANGIDLAGKGGLVWNKSRTFADSHQLIDTVRGVDKVLYSDSTGAELTRTNRVVSFNSTGFTAGNYYGPDYPAASWTFRKAAKFFDVVTYTGDGTGGRTLSHALNGTIGAVIVKRTDSTGDWYVAARISSTQYTVGDSAAPLRLNATSGGGSGFDTAPYWSSTTFKLSAFWNESTTVNVNGATYVAYVFAHDAGGFGDSGNDSVSACGSFTTDGSGNATITLGWEPQWVLVKKSSTAAGNTTDDWFIYDTMRGADVSGGQKLAANTSNAESSNSSFRNISSTGFGWSGSASATYIYIAIRRGPMKTPTDATKVYENVAYTGDQTSERVIGTSALVDFFLLSDRDATSTSWASYAHYIFDRLRGRTVSLATALTNAEGTGWGGWVDFDRQTGWDTSSSGGGGYLNKTSTKYVSHNFRRAPGFFDVVAYTGTGPNQQVTHNLGVVPEMMIIKNRGASGFDWAVYHTGIGTDFLALNSNVFGSSSNANWWDNGAPTASVIKTPSNSNAAANRSGDTFIAYLFASLTGISKVGSYTGTGTTLSVDCGFTSGARFVLIRRKDAGGDWYVWDTARGIIASNDPYLLLNSTAAEVTNTDFIDPLSSGFQISSTAPAAINANGGSYIYLAIA
jgi:hypothetical protein